MAIPLKLPTTLFVDSEGRMSETHYCFDRLALDESGKYCARGR